MKTMMKIIAFASVMLALIPSPIVYGKTDTQQERNLAVFNAVEVNSGIDLYITQGDVRKVTVQCENDVMNKVKTVVEGSTLKIYYESGFHWFQFNIHKVVVKITVKDLKSILASGGSDVFSETTLIAGDLKLEASGGSDIKMSIKAIDIDCSASGGSDLILSGAAGQLNASASGGSDIKAFELVVSKAKIEVSGGSDAFITVNKSLVGSASGGSDIKYKGDATEIKVNTSGGSDVIKD